jgi:hypothetical protein
MAIEKTTIDKMDLSVHQLYALRTLWIEETNSMLQMSKASAIPTHTTIVDLYPKLNQLDILIGNIAIFTPWAYFYPPKNFRFQRRSPFAFHRIVPFLGSYKDQEELEDKLASIDCTTSEEVSEKAAIMGCLKQIDKINEWLSFIVGRIGQFLQG